MVDTGFEAFGDWQSARKVFRAGRGMMEPAILAALHDRPMHGYEMISYLEERSQGFWRPSPGSVYPTLQLLEEKDLVTYTDHDGKKVYKLTALGKTEAEASRDHVKGAFDRFSHMDQDVDRRRNVRHEHQRHFHKQAGEIMKIIRLIFRKGNYSQRVALDHAINEFKSRVEQIWEGGK